MIDNPLGLTTEYTWKEGDTFMLIALAYRRPGQWTELLDLNKSVLQRNRYRMCAGDLIKVPESWFPLPNFSYETKFTGSKGTKDVEFGSSGAQTKDAPTFYFRVGEDAHNVSPE